MTKLGLIAGGGSFPLLVAQEARAEGSEVCAVGLEGETASDLERFTDKFIWVKIGQLAKLTEFFQEQGVSQAIMAGHVRKPKILNGSVRPDLAMVKVLTHLKNWKDNTILTAIADYLEDHGVKLINSTKFLTSALPNEGTLTKRKPTKKEWNDIKFGFTLARQVAELDIGQTVVVKDGCVTAVESIEGTDAAIRRGGQLASEGAVVVKVARPHQDMRFDVPSIGIDTVRSAAESKVHAIAIESGKTLFFQRSESIELADKHHIAIVAVHGNSL